MALLAAPAASAAPGDVYVADRDAGPGGTGAVIKVDPAGGAQQVVASGAPLQDPTGIAVDIRNFPGNDTLLVADPEALGGSGALFRVDPASGSIQTISSGNRFVDPTGVTGFLVVADQNGTPANTDLGNGDVIVVSPNGGAQTSLLSGFFLSPQLDLVDPYGLSQAPSGGLLIADPEASAGGAGAIFVIGAPVRSLGSSFSLVSQGGNLVDPTGIVSVPSGVTGQGFLAVADRSAAGSGAVVSLAGQGGQVAQAVLSSGGSFAAPSAIAYTPFAGGPLLVADRAAAGGNGALISVGAGGAQQVVSSGGSFVEPAGVAVSPPLCDGERADVVGSEAGDEIDASTFSDVIVALGGDDSVDARESDDVVCAGDGDDRVRGDSGDPLIFGFDTLLGEEGNDDLKGNREPDVLDGGPGNDFLRGKGGGKDRLDCGPGHDKATADRKDRVRGCERVKRAKK